MRARMLIDGQMQKIETTVSEVEALLALNTRSAKLCDAFFVIAYALALRPRFTHPKERECQMLCRGLSPRPSLHMQCRMKVA